MPSSLAEVSLLPLAFSAHPPVSVFGTGILSPVSEVFLGSMAMTSLDLCPPHHASASTGGFPYQFRRPLRLDELATCSRGFTFCVTPLTIGSVWHGILYPFSIGYSFRIHLRSRLTLGGRPFPRYPWAFGGKDSHLPLVTHAHIRSCASSSNTHVLPSPYCTMLPYQSADSAASEYSFSLLTFSAQSASTGELLRTLLMMAASKPTSRLSLAVHYLSHLAISSSP